MAPTKVRPNMDMKISATILKMEYDSFTVTAVVRRLLENNRYDEISSTQHTFTRVGTYDLTMRVIWSLLFKSPWCWLKYWLRRCINNSQVTLIVRQSFNEQFIVCHMVNLMLYVINRTNIRWIQIKGLINIYHFEHSTSLRYCEALTCAQMVVHCRDPPNTLLISMIWQYSMLHTYL